MAVKSNRIEVGENGVYHYRENELPTELNLIRVNSSTSLNNFTYASSVEVIGDRIVGVNEQSVDLSYSSDFSTLLNKYLKYNTFWYKLTALPTKSHSAPHADDGDFARLNVFENPVIHQEDANYIQASFSGEARRHMQAGDIIYYASAPTPKGDGTYEFIPEGNMNLHLDADYNDGILGGKYIANPSIDWGGSPSRNPTDWFFYGYTELYDGWQLYIHYYSSIVPAHWEFSPITYYDGVSTTDSGIVGTGEHSQAVTYSSSYTFLRNKYIKRNNIFYHIASDATFDKYSGFVPEQVDQDITSVDYSFGTVLEWASDYTVVDNVYSLVPESTTYTVTTNNLSTVSTALSGKYVRVSGEPIWHKCEELIRTGLSTYDTKFAYRYRNIEYPYLSDQTVKVTGRAKVFVSGIYSVDAQGYGVTLVSDPLYTFTNEEILSITGEKTVNLSSDELTIDTLTPEVVFEVKPLKIFKPTDYDGILTNDGKVFCGHFTSDLRKLPYGTPVSYYNGDTYVGKFFNKNVERIGRNHYRINAMSIIGLLDKRKHVGSVYVNTPFSNIIQEIFGNMQLSIQIQEDVASTRITGWLPYDTCRNNLHQLLFATNAVLIKGENGDLIFTYLLGNSMPTEISDEEIFDDGSVEYSTPCSSVDVTEHTFEYLDGTEPVKLFDNTESSAVINKTIIFDQAPIMPSTLTVTGTMSILSSGYNYAVVSGQGTLTGVPYIHVQHVVSKQNESATEERVVTCENATLVSAINSENVAERLLSYYSSAKTIRNGIKMSNQRVGSRYRFKDTFLDDTVAYLSKVSFSTSSFIKGDCEFIADYAPSNVGNLYSRSVLLTKADEEQSNFWVSPVAGTIRVTLIGGGNGGESGCAGEDGKDVEVGSPSYYGANGYDAGEGGEGGEHGTPGDGGNVLTFTMEVTEGQSIEFHIGEGADGGARCNSHEEHNEPTEDGGNTTFGSYTSANGGTLPYGVMDIFTGAVYALPGKDGIDGGHGSKGGERTYSAGRDSEDGQDVVFGGVTYHGGSKGTGINGTAEGDLQAKYGEFGEDCQVGGSGAGGAAVGFNGENGGDAIRIGKTLEPGHIFPDYYNETAKAGDGADALDRFDATVYGSGGDGGHGGGGGGGQAGYYYGCVYAQEDYYQGYYLNCIVDSVGEHGLGGLGSKGGKGANGAILIYL